MTKRVRLTPEVRRSQIIEAAGQLVAGQGYLPIRMDELAVRMGVSKALIYTYFPTQHDLFNAVLESDLAVLEARGLMQAAQLDDLEEALQACARLYLLHLAENGPIAHYILRDRYMAQNYDPAGLRGRDKLFRALAKRLRCAYQLSIQESLAALNMALTAPEELGHLAYRGEMGAERALALCATLVRGCISALAEPPGGLPATP